MAEEIVRIRFETTGGARAEKTTKRIGATAKASGRSVNLLQKALVGLGGALGLRELIRTADAYAEIKNRIKLVTSSGNELAVVMGRVKKIALSSNQSFESTTTLYQRLAQASKVLGKSQNDALGITQAVSDAVKVSGVSSQTASAGIRQFAQGLGRGRLDGEELSSVLENLPRLAIAIADGMGVPVTALKELGAAGAITPEVIFKAMETAAAGLRTEAESMQVTIGQAFENIKTEFIDFIGKLGEGSGVINLVGLALGGLATHFTVIASALVGFGSAWVIAKTAAIGYGIAVSGITLIQKGFTGALRITQLSILNSLYITAAKNVKALSLAQVLFATATGTATGALRIFRLALLRTGIGAIVVLLGSAIAWLVNFGSTSEKIAGQTVTGWEKIRVALSLVGGFFRPMLEALSGLFDGWKIGWDSIVGIATSAVDNILRAASGAGRAIAAIASGNPLDAFDAFSSAFSDKEGPLADVKSSYDNALADYLKNRPNTGKVNLDTPLGTPPDPAVDPKNTAKASKAAKAAAEAAIRQAEKVRDSIADMGREKSVLEELSAARNMSEIGLQKLTSAREAEDKIRELGISQTSTEADRIRTLASEITNLSLARDAALEIRQEFEDIVPSFEAQSAALMRWRDDTQATLATAGNGWEEYANQVDVVFDQRLKDAYMRNLEMSKSAADGVQRSLLKIAEENSDMATMMEGITTNAFSSMEDSLVEFTKTGKFAFKDFADSIVEDITRMIVKTQITGPLAKMLSDGQGASTGQGGGFGGILDLFSSGGSAKSGAGKGSFRAAQDAGISQSGGGGLISSLSSGIGSLFSGFGDLFSFANGGSFNVGGAGGTDSQLVAFRASPNETVTVRRPDQSGSSINITNNFTINAPNGIPRETQAQIAARVGEHTQRAMRRNN